MILHIIITSHNKLCCYRELLGTQAQGFFGNIKRNAFDFENHTARRNRGNESLRITFTFTHTYVGRLLSDWLIGEYSNPNLTLTLHITSDSDTGSLDLATGNPFSL